ncbi:hypothetical protein C1646_751904 [Rhizophagus diaphanus]|nr:hypothetical protein C1646_751904 [Rhizophagus diaphanus] [Rhizophagus sp. MUCL 43196]
MEFHNEELIENTFALTVHKTQGLILSDVTVPLDSQMFADGQASAMPKLGIL